MTAHRAPRASRSAAIVTTLVITWAILTSCRPPARCPEVLALSDAATADAPHADSSHADPTPIVIIDSDGGTATFNEPFDMAGGYTSQPCADACTNLLRLGCPEGGSRPGEDSCYVVCRRAEATGGRIDFRPRCVSAARDRAALRACATYRCQ